MELAFPNPASVKGFVAGDGRVSLDFAVTNRYASIQRFSWSVVAQVDGRGASHVLARGHRGLPVDATFTRRVKAHVTCNRRTKVEVRVSADQGSSTAIHFWSIPDRTIGDGPSGTRWICRTL